MKQYFGIDIGGTAVKLGIVDETGAVGPKAEESVNFDSYQTPVLTTVLKTAKAFVETQNIDVNTLEGVGVSATGQIDSRKGIVAGTCGNFPNYINSPIQAELERLFGLPVTVANDANCMTLGEVWVGGAKGYTDVIGVTLGTGVGGGLMRDMMAGEEPYIFVKHIYACASLVGGICCVWLYRSIGRLPAVFIAAFVVMAIRFLAAHFRWNLPHPKTLS